MGFENKTAPGTDIHYSRFIASWLKGTKAKIDWEDFYNWLIMLGVDQHTAYEIFNLATNGKLELETSAMLFLKKKEQEAEH